MSLLTRIFTCTCIFLHSCVCFGATGDLLYSNCAGAGCTGAVDNSSLTRTIETTGCYSGSCLKLEAKYDGNNYGGSAAISASGVSGENEVTIVFYTKLSSATISSPILKVFRVLNGDATHYFMSGVAPWYGQDFYFSYNTGTTTPESTMTPYVQTNPGQKTLIPVGDGTYTSPEGRIAGTFDVSGEGGSDGLGAYWTKIRVWIKLPSTTSATDGEAKMWVDGELLFTSVDMGFSAGTPQATVSGITFYPSSEASGPFDQWMDEMSIYEGYVPPDSDAVAGMTIQGNWQ